MTEAKLSEEEIKEQYPEDIDRWAKKRGQYLASTTDYNENKLQALAYAELGYSEAGISKRVDVTSSTVKSWFEDIEKEYGATVFYPRLDKFGLDVDLEDRSAFTDLSCPKCASSQLVGEVGLQKLPYSLKSVRDKNGNVWPVTSNRKKRIHGELIDLTEEDKENMFSFRERFLSGTNKKDLICCWCHWMGNRTEVIG